MKNIFFFITAFFFSAQCAIAAEVQEVVSENGIKAWLVEEHSVPLVAVRVAFTGSGYAYDSKGKEGRAGMAAAMLTEGAGDMNYRAFNEAVESRAIALTASVDDELLNVSMETLGEHMETAFSYLGMVLAAPRFDEDALAHTRRQGLAIIKQQQQNPGYRLWEAWQQTAFTNHPYSNPPMGTPESIAAMTRGDLETFRSHHMTQGNMMIAVVGDITPESLKRLLDENFSSLPQEFAPLATTENTTPAAPPAEIKHVAFDIPQTMIMFGLPAIDRHDPAFYDAYVLNHILGAGALTSRLNKELREKRGLTYGVATQLDPAKYAPLWRGQFSTKHEEAAGALDVLKTTLQEVGGNGVSKEELAEAKKFITGSFVLNLDSNADVANFLITIQTQNLGMDYLKKRNALMEAVTLDGVNKAAKQLLDMEKLVVVTLGKPAEAEKAAP